MKDVSECLTASAAHLCPFFMFSRLNHKHGAAKEGSIKTKLGML